MAVINMNIFSMYVKQNMDVNVVIPDSAFKEEMGKQYPCVWLYHGGSGDHTEWLYHTKLVDMVEERQFVAVLPNVHESCFVDMNIGPKYGTYVARELPGIIYNMFKCISSKREDNYVAGYSNGGYGCLHVALRHPMLFKAVGAFSAGDKADAIFDNDGSDKSKHRVNLFGDGDLHNNKYGLTYMADRLKEKIQNNEAEAPVIYHACGGKDPWLWMNHIVRDYFEENSEYFNYKYNEIPHLGHEWEFWETELNNFLNYVNI